VPSVLQGDLMISSRCLNDIIIDIRTPLSHVHMYTVTILLCDVHNDFVFLQEWGTVSSH